MRACSLGSRPTARAAASADDHKKALQSYEEALGLWRGDVLAGVELEGDAQIDVARLDQERRLVAEERIDSALACGKHRELIPELERSVGDAPLRERSRAQLMLALYRAGRQTEALERYREGRALLVEQAGVEPGRELRELERAILTQDPALEVAPTIPTDERAASYRLAPPRLEATCRGAGRAARGGASRSSCSWSTTRVPPTTLAQINANSAGAIDPGSNRLVQQVQVQSGPGRIAAGFESLWVVNDFDSSVSRIDPASGTVVETIPVDGDPTAIAVGAGFVWVACTRHAQRRSDQPAEQQARAAGWRRKRPERHRDQPSNRVGDEPARRHRD